MANLEHVALLRQGVEAWNRWREKHPDVNPDLSVLSFSGINLDGFDLHNTILWGSNFGGSSLREALLTRASLQRAYLFGVDLTGADLRGAFLSEAALGPANLYEADLSSADLLQANLSGACLYGAKLHKANLTKADLTGANFTNADLSESILLLARAVYTNFEGAILTGACIQDWSISEGTILSNVSCDYIYHRLGLTEQLEERRPSDPDKKFKPGEFTKLFQKVLSTVDLFFRDGVDWNALLISLEKLRVEAEGAELSIQAIENKNDGAFVIRVNVPLEANKAEIERFLKRQYEIEIKVIDEKYQFQLQLQGERLEEYRDQIKIQRQENTDLRRIVEKMADKEAPKYDMRGSTFGNFADTVQSGAKFQDTQNIYSPEQRQNLAEAAAEIQQLLDQLAQMDQTSTEVVAEAIHQEIKRNPTLKARLVSALKAGGLEALKAIFDHPLFSIPAETVKGWLEAE
uniref:pentapeptide repeat-containing protein n=1 Tax=Trichocoleus desertorum TaxID=1481672 RepID=UPI0025B2E2A0|nr:pentapeptide repeat-containing protein [Trichocoleus desertorum]